MANTETTTLNKINFERALINAVKYCLNDDTTVEILDVPKTNSGLKRAMVFKSVDTELFSSPTIYIRPLYDKYLYGQSVPALAEDSVNIYAESRNRLNFDIHNYLNFDIAKSRITCRLINRALNRDLLTMVPHQDFYDDLAIVYYYCLDDDERSILVRNAHTDIWGIDNESEYLHTIALSNTRRLYPPRITSINQILSDIPGSTCDLSAEDNKLFVLTNEKAMYGAVSLLYDDVLAAACRQLGSSKIYLLTSSIHETIVLPADSVDGYKAFRPKALKEIIKDINITCVDECDILGEFVFSFSIETGKLLMEA